MLKLKGILQDMGQPQAALAQSLGVSSAAVAQLVNHNLWPRRLEGELLRGRIRAFYQPLVLTMPRLLARLMRRMRLF